MPDLVYGSDDEEEDAFCAKGARRLEREDDDSTIPKYQHAFFGSEI